MSKININHHKSDHQVCEVRLFGGTDLVECMTQRTDCQWAMRIGHTSLMCKNPSAIQYVYSNKKRRNLHIGVKNDL